MTARGSVPVHRPAAFDGWRAAGASSRGKLHEVNDRPNQDAFGYDASLGGPIAIVVSDGHGGDAHFRSDVGSRLAVEAALDVLRRPPPALAESLIAAWRARVMEHIAAQPFSIDEQAIFTQRGWGDPAEAYGATLLAIAVYQREIVYVQLGDGDLLRVASDGKTERLFKKDPKLAINQTYSLCDPAAAMRVRIKRESRGRRQPALLLAVTDGFVNAFANDRALFLEGPQLLQQLEQVGLEMLTVDLPQLLKELSDARSLDDITLAMLVPAERR